MPGDLTEEQNFSDEKYTETKQWNFTEKCCKEKLYANVYTMPSAIAPWSLVRASVCYNANNNNNNKVNHFYTLLTMVKLFSVI